MRELIVNLAATAVLWYAIGLTLAAIATGRLSLAIWGLIPAVIFSGLWLGWGFALRVVWLVRRSR